MMKFSLVVATYRRREVLISFLDSLRAQTYKNYEVIVVDQNAENFIADELKEYEDLPIKYVKMEKAGLSRARNRGLQEVSGDVVSFPDDDCVYETDLLEKVSRLCLIYPDYFFFSGKMKHIDFVSEVLSAKFQKKQSEISLFNCLRTTISVTLFFRHQEGDIYFDEDLGAGEYLGSGEESDLVMRLLKEKKRGLYLPQDICVYHPDTVFTSDAISIKRCRSYARGMGALLKKHAFYERQLPCVILVLKMLFLRPLGGVIIGILKANANCIVKNGSTFFGRIVGFLSYKKSRYTLFERKRIEYRSERLLRKR